MLDWPGKTRKLSPGEMGKSGGPLVAGQQVGDYVVDKKLAEGGFGAVYAAEQQMIGKRVAIKVLRRNLSRDAEAVRRFIGEARAVNAIGHANIVDIFGFGQLEDHRYFYVMELLNGMSLQDHIDAQGALDPGFVLEVLAGVASALRAAHERGIIHRDLKPDNIYVVDGSGGRPQGKLLDFGIAKLTATMAEKLNHHTEDGAVIGTPYFMAPEQSLGRPIDVRTDVYAFGVCAFFALSGKVPFDGFDLMSICTKHATEKRPRVSDFEKSLPRSFDKPLQRMMAIEPAERFGSIEEAFEALQEAARRGGIRLPSMVPASQRPSRIPLWVGLGAAIAAAGAFAWLQSRPSAGKSEMKPAASATVPTVASTIRRGRLAAYVPLKAPVNYENDPQLRATVELGKALFFDKRLSRAQDLSCGSCHDLADNGADHAAMSIGHAGQRGLRNTPTIFNVAGAFAFNWDGVVKTLEEHAPRPLLSPQVMAANEDIIVQRLSADPSYRRKFELAFPKAPAPSLAHVAKALAAYQRQLVTPSRWDDFLKGKKSALTPDEKRGFNTFVQVGCPTCHFGERVGLTMFQKLGLVKPWPKSTDPGRHRITKREEDWMVFRVPTLRNIAKTAPYLHDGSIAELSKVVRLMARHQLDKELTAVEVQRIVGWLKTLSGNLPKKLLPKSD